jgi:hypothetical protein
MIVEELMPGIVAEIMDETAVAKEKLVDHYLQVIVNKLKVLPLGLSFLQEFEASKVKDNWLWKRPEYERCKPVSIRIIALVDLMGERQRLAEKRKKEAEEREARRKLEAEKKGIPYKPLPSFAKKPAVDSSSVKYPPAECLAAEVREPNTGATIVTILPGHNQDGYQVSPTSPWEFEYYGKRQTLEIAFIHELIHAYLAVSKAPNMIDNKITSDKIAEEERVVGLLEYKQALYTENRFRHYLNYKDTYGFRNQYVSFNGSSRKDDAINEYDFHHLTERALRGEEDIRTKEDKSQVSKTGGTTLVHRLKGG